MQDDRIKAEGTSGPTFRTSRRKPYSKPQFRYERVFETMALACGKVSPTQSHCRFIRKSS